MRDAALFVALSALLSSAVGHAQEAPSADAPPPPDPTTETTIGWNGLRVARSDGAFRVELHALLQLRAEVLGAEGGPFTSLATVHKARPQLIFAALDDRLVLMVQAEFGGGSASLLDARLDARIAPWATLAVGQLIVPFNRSFNIPLPVVQAPERAGTTARFAPGRRVGGHAHLTPADGIVEVWLGAYDPIPLGGPHDRARPPLGVARIQVNPLGRMPTTELPSLDGPAATRFALGAATVLKPSATATGAPAPDVLAATFTADFGVQSRGFTSYADGFVDWIADEMVGWGATAQVAQFVVPQHLNLGARATVIDPTPADDVGPTWNPELLLGGFVHGTNLYVMLREGVTVSPSTPLGFRTTLQVQARM